MNIQEFLDNKKILPSGLIVRTTGNIVKFEIIGYIPVVEDEFFSIDKTAIGYSSVRIENDEIRINNYSKTQRYTYLPKAETIILSDNKQIEIDYKKLFYIGNNIIKKSIRNNHELLLKEHRDLFSLNGQTLLYNTQPFEKIFKWGDRVVSVSDNFACICAYISPISGKLEYTIQHPDNLIITLNNE